MQTLNSYTRQKRLYTAAAQNSGLTSTQVRQKNTGRVGAVLLFELNDKSARPDPNKLDLAPTSSEPPTICDITGTVPAICTILPPNI